MPCAASLGSGSWHVSRASVTGTSHIRAGLPCQDSSNHHVAGDVLIAAVADGAGSAAKSDVGSSLAAEVSVRTAELLLQETHDHSPHPIHATCLKRVVYGAVEQTRRELHHEAKCLDVDVRELATTLLLMVHTQNILAAGQIGDGAMVVSEGAGDYVTFITPQRGEYANQTNFVTTPEAMSRLDIRIEQMGNGLSRLAMFTDGLQNLVLRASDDSPHAPFFDPVFAWMGSQPGSVDTDQKLAAFLKSPRVTSRADDDLTLLLAAFRE